MSYVYLLSDRKGLYYVGKTSDIRQRIIQHKSYIRHQGKCTSRYLDLDFDCQILEEYSNEIDLAQGERKYHDIYREKLGDKLVNNNQPLRTMAEWYVDNPEYYKQYYAENADKIKARLNQKYNCECGGRYTHNNKTRHLRSRQHILNSTPHLD